MIYGRKLKMTKKDNKMLWEYDLEAYLKSHDKIPQGYFCYYDITPSLRYFCPYYNNKKCKLALDNTDINDYIKICDTYL